MKYTCGVEYQTNGKKPSLPDDVSVIALSKLTGYWLPCFPVGEVNWRHIEKFKIVDERYKPKKQDMNDWYEKGEKPPVGAVVELLWGGVSQGDVEIISYRKNGSTVVFWRLYIDHVDSAEIPSAQFRPIRTEKDKLVEQAKAICKSWDDSCGRSIPELFVEANWKPFKPMGEDDFVVECVSKFSLRKVSPDAQEACCELSRAIYQAGCRFIQKGEHNEPN